MKRIAILLLILLLILPTLASAQAPFSLRNGYTWGMPLQGVKTLAQQEDLTYVGEELSDGEYSLTYSNAPVGKYEAEELYMVFTSTDDGDFGLQLCLYIFPEEELSSSKAKDVFSYLQDSLTNLYGQPSDSVREWSNAFLCWSLDNTLIELGDLRFSSGNATYFIRYSSNKFVDIAATESLDTIIVNEGF